MTNARVIKNETDFYSRLDVETITSSGRWGSVGHIVRRKKGNHMQRQPQLNTSIFYALNQKQYADWQAAIILLMAEFDKATEAWEKETHV
jgi:hypothetical protein